MQNRKIGVSAQKIIKIYEEVVVFDSLTNVRRGDTISSHSTKEVTIMTAVNSMNSSAFSCSTAVAVASARNSFILDTAPVLAVSICVLPMLRICRTGT